MPRQRHHIRSNAQATWSWRRAKQGYDKQTKISSEATDSEEEMKTVDGAFDESKLWIYRGADVGY